MDHANDPSGGLAGMLEREPLFDEPQEAPVCGRQTDTMPRVDTAITHGSHPLRPLDVLVAAAAETSAVHDHAFDRSPRASGLRAAQVAPITCWMSRGVANLTR